MLNLIVKFSLNEIARARTNVKKSLVWVGPEACLHRAFVFAVFCIIQCRKHFHPSMVSMGDANASTRCKRAPKPHSHLRFSSLLQLFDQKMAIVSYCKTPCIKITQMAKS